MKHSQNGPGDKYSWPKLFEFGTQLFKTGDLDPVYIGLLALQKDQELLKRWLVAYYCFYHCGVACWIAERTSLQFWTAMRIAAENSLTTPCGGRWPRSPERRHFRGVAAIRSIKELQKRYPYPEQMINYLVLGMDGDPVVGTKFAEMRKRVHEHYLMGDWLSFKVADMAERVLRIPVQFSLEDIFMYKEPAAAALMVYAKWPFCGLVGDNPRDTKLAVSAVVHKLIQAFSKFKAPPHYDRPIGLQEVETVLCRWKSYVKGTYFVGKDTHEIREGLKPWLQHSEVARKFEKAFPKDICRPAKLW